MRPKRTIYGLILLVVVVFNLYLLFRSQHVQSLVNYEHYPSHIEEEMHAQAQANAQARREQVNPDGGDGLNEEEDLEDVSSNDVSGNNINAAVEENKKESGSEKYLFNYGEQPRSYKKGMRQIKRVLHKIAGIAPGAGPFRPETDYYRDIKSDTPLQEGGELPATSFILGLYLQLSDEEVGALAASHAKVMSELPKEVVSNSFGGRGVVMTGGGKYFPMVLTAIKWLRETDPEIPVEVFMEDTSEYEKTFCDDLFPKINVECRVIKQIYGAGLYARVNSKYALKPLAILASKFDDIYFMDADSYPVTSVGAVFDWEVYQQNGYILNADYWPRYISPRFYDIVGRQLGGRARGSPDDHALLQSDRENAVPGHSTESGQIFVKKSQHIRSLMLATYYNLYGPDVYFPLLMQNGHGEGDKDTYAAAAVICDEEYYQTLQRPVTLGQHLPDGSYKGFAMGQPHPIVDYDLQVVGKKGEPQMLALHANGIKSNVKYLLMEEEDPIRGAPRLRQQRFFGNMDNVRKEMRSNEDVEQRLFRVMRDVACQWALNQNYVPRDWEDQDLQRLCRVLSAHTQWLREHPDVSAPPDAQFWFDLDRRGRVRV